jgi:outer membrane PBP1 activator LpoA protein
MHQFLFDLRAWPVRHASACLSWACILVLALLVSGCATGPSAPVGEPAMLPDEVARELLASGRYAEAANAYMELAKQFGSPDREEFQLAAASAFLSADDPGTARSILARLPAESLPEHLAPRRRILSARVALADGNAEQALRLIGQLELARQPTHIVAEAREVSSLAHARLGNSVASVRDRVALELLLEQPQRIRSNRESLWQTLDTMDSGALRAQLGKAPDTLTGWLELKLIEREFSLDGPAYAEAITRWQTRFPGHPATVTVLPALTEMVAQLAQKARRIALLLPLTGRLSNLSAAVRDGFLSAWFLDAREERPAINLFDTSIQDTAGLLASIKASGANFIVGPLRKDVSRNLTDARPGLPVLMLNRLPPAVEQPEPAAQPQAASSAQSSGTSASTAGTPDTKSPGEASDDVRANATSTVYQFGLAPEQEAAAVAEYAYEQGHRSAAALVPTGDWGERIYAAFERSWLEVGGELVSTGRYNRNAQTLGPSVKQMLAIDASENRYQKLRATLGKKVEYSGRRRQDVDMIFLAGFPREARQLRPQVQFYKGSNLPIFSTSHIFTGVSNPSADIDLDGIIFADMPWIVDGRTLAERGVDIDAIKRARPVAASALGRMFAFGFDAYQLATRVGELRSGSIGEWHGLTGKLHIAPDLTVRRNLAWAAFKKGVPQPVP